MWVDQPGTSGWNKPHLATASNRYRSLRTQNGEAICGSPYSVPIVPGGVGIRSSQSSCPVTVWVCHSPRWLYNTRIKIIKIENIHIIYSSQIMSYQILTFSTTSEHSYLEDPGLQICEDGLSTLPVNPQSLTSWDPTTVVYSTKSKVLLQSHSHREITKKNVLPVHANSMIMWTLEETSCWEAVDKSCQGVKHTFRALKPWSSVLCFRNGYSIQMPQSEIRGIKDLIIILSCI